MPETRSFSEVIEDINDTLSEMSGEDLADLANKILSATYTYEGDSIFTVKSK
jgi:hypothetical protein